MFREIFARNEVILDKMDSSQHAMARRKLTAWHANRTGSFLHALQRALCTSQYALGVGDQVLVALSSKVMSESIKRAFGCGGIPRRITFSVFALLTGAGLAKSNGVTGLTLVIVFLFFSYSSLASCPCDEPP